MPTLGEVRRSRLAGVRRDVYFVSVIARMSVLVCVRRTMCAHVIAYRHGSVFAQARAMGPGS